MSSRSAHEPAQGDRWVPSLAVVGCAGAGRTFRRVGRKVMAVRPCTLAVPAGCQVALTGPSGSGKSTLLRLLAGREKPTSGTVAWPGLSGSPLGRPSALGMIPQQPSLDPALEVTENIALPLTRAGMSGAEAEARAAAALERLGLSALASTLPAQLSASQLRFAAVARVLAGHPRLILADEPASGLDRDIADLVVTVLLKTAEQLGAALIVSTQDPLIAVRFPERWHMSDGHLSAASARVRGSGDGADDARNR